MLGAPVHDCAPAETKIRVAAQRRVTLVLLDPLKVEGCIRRDGLAPARARGRLPLGRVARPFLSGVVVTCVGASVHVQEALRAAPVFRLSACEGHAEVIAPFRCEECASAGKCTAVVEVCEWSHA